MSVSTTKPASPHAPLSQLFTAPLENEPAWPDPGGRRIVFLADASSRVEARLLRAWAARARARTGAGAPDFAWIAIPPSRRRARRPTRRALDPALEAMLAADDDPLLAPVRVAWLPRLVNGERAVRVSDLWKLGDPRDPGWLRQAWVLALRRDRCRVVAGRPAPASDLRRRWREAGGADAGQTGGLAEFVARQAAFALERAERSLRGARYKVPRLVHEEILGRPAFRGGLGNLALEEGIALARATRRAAANLREIAAAHSPFVIDLASVLIRWIYTRSYGETLQYDREKLAGIAKLAQRHPVVFLPTHKSNLDHLVLQYMLYENGLPPNHTAGGINMNFFPVGQLVRRSGVFFIRRTFKDNPIYKHVLRSYVDYLIEKRFNLEWYIEGGRSRSGKLLPPRFGMLAYVVDAWRRGKSDDVYLIPVSIAYDLIQDVGAYCAEAQGGAKQTESFGWFVDFLRGFSRRSGDIHIRFGEPLSLRAQLGTRESDAATPPDEPDLALQKLAFEVAVRINRVTPITPTSLVTLALLGWGDRAVTVPEVRASLVNLLDTVEERKRPATTALEPLRTDEGVRAVLEALEGHGLLSCYSEGLEAVYVIERDQELTAAYYRNTVVHFFVIPALCELALLRAAEPPAAGERGEDPVEVFRDETMRLRDLFKFEFFFAEKDAFRREIHDEMQLQDPHWEERLRNGPEAIHALVQGMRPFSAHRTLRPFLESYQVVAETLARWDPESDFDESRFLTACLGLAKQRLLQRRIHSGSSVSKVLFQTALRLARNRGLVEQGAAESAPPSERRETLAVEIRDALRRAEAIAALAASRRAGLIP
jgi:glycerol-3-phosphate O-acyltransferase